MMNELMNDEWINEWWMNYNEWWMNDEWINEWWIN